MNYKTDQEEFWAGEFGTHYTERNNSEELLSSSLNLFSTILNKCEDIKSAIEFGANRGLNLNALRLLVPNIELDAIEINKNAATELKKNSNIKNIYNESILEWEPEKTYDLVIICGVLIHINPDYLKEVYKLLYKSSKKYILVSEYYNPTPVMIGYRGNKDKLFKRDFAGEIMDNFKNLSLLDYGFCYHRDNFFPRDDGTWFLLRK